MYRDIPSYEGVYQITKTGLVRSLDRVVKTSRGSRTYKGKRVKSYIDKKGYLYTQLNKSGKIKTIKIHQLVAMTYLGHKPNGFKGLVVDHIDNNKLNNNLNNLQLITNRENLSKDRKGVSKYTGVSWCKQTNKWKARIKINKVECWRGS